MFAHQMSYSQKQYKHLCFFLGTIYGLLFQKQLAKYRSPWYFVGLLVLMKLLFISFGFSGNILVSVLLEPGD